VIPLRAPNSAETGIAIKARGWRTVVPNDGGETDVMMPFLKATPSV
jgi:hypothetical protein